MVLWIRNKKILYISMSEDSELMSQCTIMFRVIRPEYGILEIYPILLWKTNTKFSLSSLLCSKWGKQETQRCPCILGKALGGHLEMLLAVGEGSDGLCRLVLCIHVLVCRNPARSHLLMCKNFADKPWAKQCICSWGNVCLKRCKYPMYICWTLASGRFPQ